MLDKKNNTKKKRVLYYGRDLLGNSLSKKGFWQLYEVYRLFGELNKRRIAKVLQMSHDNLYNKLKEDIKKNEEIEFNLKQKLKSNLDDNSTSVFFSHEIPQDLLYYHLTEKAKKIYNDHSYWIPINNKDPTCPVCNDKIYNPKKFDYFFPVRCVSKKRVQEVYFHPKCAFKNKFQNKEKQE